ncbi:MAG: hypothetical protein RBT42_03830 [Aquabacterium sp.]|jgi:hypothetical protein|uniref:pilus assembly PilX family protein n=1 Tax=Aquabacterium sp. TaxID=1872578 RepID=UPI002A36FE31|nr:PilX N-terminal domain-containing pilus assembly protein [Aquabacterium sp.]MDX9842861.1 hypothetical protein [Aquabacterium sp.]
MPEHLFSRRPQTSQHGIALIVVLVMLAVISLVSGASLRAALSAEQITHNVRLESLAKEAAHIGLRHCEEALLQTPPALTVHPAPVSPAPALWTLWSSWHGSHALAHTVPASAMSSADSAYVPASRPQCLLENHPAHPDLITVTARGFSPDHQADSAGRTTRGAMAWVQSVVHRCIPDSALCPAAPAIAPSSPTTASAPSAPAVATLTVTSVTPASPASSPASSPRLHSRVWRALLNPPSP